MPQVDLSQRPLTPREKLWQAIAQECFGIEGMALPTDIPDGKIKREIERTALTLWNIESEPGEVIDAMQYWVDLRGTPCPSDARHIEEAVHQHRAYRKQLIMGDPHWWKDND